MKKPPKEVHHIFSLSLLSRAWGVVFLKLLGNTYIKNSRIAIYITPFNSLPTQSVTSDTQQRCDHQKKHDIKINIQLSISSIYMHRI